MQPNVLTLATGRHSPSRYGALPIEVRVYLREVAFVAHEAARLGLRLLASQAARLNELARSGQNL